MISSSESVSLPGENLIIGGSISASGSGKWIVSSKFRRSVSTFIWFSSIKSIKLRIGSDKTIISLSVPCFKQTNLSVRLLKLMADEYSFLDVIFVFFIASFVKEDVQKIL